MFSWTDIVCQFLSACLAVSPFYTASFLQDFLKDNNLLQQLQNDHGFFAFLYFYTINSFMAILCKKQTSLALANAFALNALLAEYNFVLLQWVFVFSKEKLVHLIAVSQHDYYVQILLYNTELSSSLCQLAMCVASQLKTLATSLQSFLPFSFLFYGKAGQSSNDYSQSIQESQNYHLGRFRIFEQRILILLQRCFNAFFYQLRYYILLLI